MITRHHLALALICALILCSSFLVTDLPAAVSICAGTCIGVLLPDIHMSRPKKANFRMLAWAMIQLPRIACSGLLYRIYSLLGLPVTAATDKRLTHSFPGILFITACAGLVLFLPTNLIYPTLGGEVALFVGGLLLGMVLHLAEDLCTRKGIFPLFPFRPEKIAGSIRPCDHADPRIAWYHIQHASVLLVLLFLEGTGILAPAFAFPASLAGLAACLGVMVYSSDITIQQDPSPAGPVPVPAPVQGTNHL